MKRSLFLMYLSMIFLAGCAPVRVAPTNTALPTVTVTASTLGIGSTVIADKDGMILMYVPAGEFTMGSKAEDALPLCEKFGASCPLDLLKNEEPPHTVYLDAFWIDQTEVTNAMYTKCVQAGQCEPPTAPKSYTRDSYYDNSQFKKFPVVLVAWGDAEAYCAWSDRRLPTEAEWEKAARGEDARAYPWGNDFPSNDLLNFRDFIGDTTVVGKYPNGASPYDALDMAGNVWEWVADWYDGTYYATSPLSNPPGPDSGTERVLRGGGFGSRIYTYRSTFRYIGAPAETYAWVGFRCAMSATP
jgi:eukaryotic-like serine/threonine-protein kinase